MKRVLVIRCGALGDLVYATSVIDALLLEYGEDTHIDFVCTPGSGKLFENDPRVQQVFPLKHKKIPLFLSAEKKAIIKASKKEPYDILVNFEYGKQFLSLIESINAHKKIGANLSSISIPEHINRGEMIKYFLKDIISQEHLEKAYPRLYPEKKDIGIDEYIVISPTNSHIKRSGINYRAWENSKWSDLIKKLHPKTVVFVGSPGEEWFFEDFKPYPSNVVDLVGKLSISQLIGVIQNAKGVICTDSAIGHISAAVNTPVFVLMGPNDTITDSPYKTPFNSVNPISLHLPCSPCYKTPIMKECKDNICMKQITPEHVLNALQSHQPPLV